METLSSTPVIHNRLVRNSDVDQGRPMITLRKVLSFVFQNRRLIGSIIGSGLILAGYPNEGTKLNEVSELL